MNDGVFLRVTYVLVLVAIVGSVTALLTYARFMPMAWILLTIIRVFTMILVIPLLRSRLASSLISLSIALGVIALVF